MKINQSIVLASCLAFSSFVIAAPAMAQISELRVGIAEFDENTLDLPFVNDFAGDENSVAITGEVLFEEPEFLKWALSPQPYIGGTLNLEGDTSFAGGGLLWRQTVGKKFYGDFALGLVVHDGTTRIEPSDEFVALLNQANGFETIDDIPEDLLNALISENNQFIDRFDTEIEFGSRVLFRLQGAIGYNFNEDWAGEVYIEHLSNGGVFSDERNDGVNILGLRAARKF